MFIRKYFLLDDYEEAGPSLKQWLCFIMTGATTATGNTDKLLDNLILKYRYHAIMYKDYNPYVGEQEPTTPTVTDRDYKEFTNKIRYVYTVVKDKYDVILNAYTAQKDNLFNKLKSSTQFNDTPQTTDTGLDDDDYASTYSTTTVDYEVMDRLNKVSRLYENVMDDYIKEFSGLFIEVD